MEDIDEINDFAENAVYTSPEPRSDTNLFSLFKDVLDMDDSTKVANLNESELGNLDVSVRGAKKVQLIAQTIGEPSVMEFFKAEAEILNATSMAKKGFLSELFVSQKKFSSANRNITQDLKQAQAMIPQKKGAWPQKQNQ